MGEMEKLVDGVAEKLRYYRTKEERAGLLNTRLLALLEAGAVLANSKTRNDFNEAVGVYDAALRKAMEGL